MQKVLCKICDIKDFETAKLCAQLGVDFIGLHAIWKIKKDKLGIFKKICHELPILYPQTKIVLVTKQTSVLIITEMAKELNPSYIQLHNKLAPLTISCLRTELDQNGGGDIKFIGVDTLNGSMERIIEIKSLVDILLLDTKLYENNDPGSRKINSSLYKKAISLVAPTPVMIAGGLTPENVSDYLKEIQPAGVDVQTGIEIPFSPGIKDRTKLSLFINIVKKFQVNNK